MKIKKTLQFKRRAFTLVELVVALAITGIMLTIATQITVGLMRDSLKSDLRSEVDRNVNYAVETMKRNIIASSEPVQVLKNGSSCNPGTQVTCLYTNYITPKYFMLDGNKLIQCNDAACATGSVKKTNLIGNDVIIDGLNFEAGTGGFIQISFNAYDANNIVYPSTAGLAIITGAIGRGSSL